jgi:hypothetical protein
MEIKDYLIDIISRLAKLEQGFNNHLKSHEKLDRKGWNIIMVLIGFFVAIAQAYILWKIGLK